MQMHKLTCFFGVLHTVKIGFDSVFRDLLNRADGSVSTL